MLLFFFSKVKRNKKKTEEQSRGERIGNLAEFSFLFLGFFCFSSPVSCYSFSFFFFLGVFFFNRRRRGARNGVRPADREREREREVGDGVNDARGGVRENKGGTPNNFLNRL